MSTKATVTEPRSECFLFSNWPSASVFLSVTRRNCKNKIVIVLLVFQILKEFPKQKILSFIFQDDKNAANT